MNKFPHLVFVYGTLKRSEPNHVNYMKHPSRGTNSWIGNTALEFGGKNAILIYLFNFENFLPSTSILPYFWYIIIGLFSHFYHIEQVLDNWLDVYHWLWHQDTM